MRCLAAGAVLVRGGVPPTVGSAVGALPGARSAAPVQSGVGAVHELGIVFSIMDTVEEVARDNQVTCVSSVTLEVGEVASIVEYYLKDCWRWAVQRSEVLADSELVIKPLPAVTYCEACDSTDPTVEHGRTCPHCGSGRTYLLTGNELNILEIEAR